jgi:ComF family protein
MQSLEPIRQARCNVCGHVLAAAEATYGDACCGACSMESPAFERAVNYGAYRGVLRQLIHLLKYQRVRVAAHPLGRLTADACLQLEGDVDVAELLMIPVPTHKLRMRSRGFNQAELIARSAQRGIEASIGRRVKLDVTALLRVRFAESQVALNAEQRRQQIRGAFKVISESVKGREILLVDDVLTTGATASECARELRLAGAARVWVATPARALGRDADLGDLGRSEPGEAADSESQRSPQFSLSGKSLSGNLTSGKATSGTAQESLLRRRGIPLTHGEQRAGCRLLAAVGSEDYANGES